MEKTLTSKVPVWVSIAVPVLFSAGLIVIGLGGLAGTADTFRWIIPQ